MTVAFPPTTKVALLRAECAKRNLPTSGLKADLLHRLNDALAQEDEPNKSTENDRDNTEETHDQGPQPSPHQDQTTEQQPPTTSHQKPIVTEQEQPSMCHQNQTSEQEPPTTSPENHITEREPPTTSHQDQPTPLVDAPFFPTAENARPRLPPEVPGAHTTENDQADNSSTEAHDSAKILPTSKDCTISDSAIEQEYHDPQNASIGNEAAGVAIKEGDYVTDNGLTEGTDLQALRSEAEALRRQHQELTTLCAQWYQAVAALQAQQAHSAPMNYGAFSGQGNYGVVPSQGHGPATSRPESTWAEHYTPEGQVYYYNANTGQSSWERPADFGAKRVGKTKGPIGANLFIACNKGSGGVGFLTDEDLRQAFAGFGELVRCEMSVDKNTGQPKAFGFVSYQSPEIADAAMAQMQGQYIGDKQIRIEKTNT